MGVDREATDHPPAPSEALANPIKQGIEGILEGFVRARETERFGSKSSVSPLFERLQQALLSCSAVRHRSTLEVKVSTGLGRWADVPWVAFLDTRETKSTTDGVYCVLLFRKDMSGVYLAFQQGVTTPDKRFGKKAPEWLRALATLLRMQHRGLSEGGFVLGEPALKGDSNLAKSYETATVSHKLYEVGKIPSDAAIVEDLEHLLTVYDEYLRSDFLRPQSTPPAPSTTAPPPAPESEPPPVPQADLAEVCARFGAALRESHVHLPQELVSAFVASLAAKPFVILTGLSGSGKTQLALRFGQWLGAARSTVIPVRPDWTGAEALFGYEDALLPALDGRRAWHAPQALQFFLQAAADPDHPYLLVLDEMNLAHVERYFADVLSGMESREACLPNLTLEGDGYFRCPKDGFARIAIPKNIFIVGTVNIDETTYLFSPKVLDRANTFEFRVPTDALMADFNRPVACKAGAPELTAGFLQIVQDEGFLQQHPAPAQDVIVQRLRALHALLSEDGFEFGHRSFYESVRFAAMLAAAGASDADHALDRIVLQKILPRLHGARRRLEAPLCALGRFCIDPAQSASAPSNKTALDLDAKQPRLPGAYAKVRRMLLALRANQFVSFTE